MKNREKYREEIITTLREHGTLEKFYNKHIAPHYKTEEYNHVLFSTMLITTVLWLDDEYVEPEIDWSAVPVDTLIEVRNNETDPWTPRYFKEYKSSMVYVWGDGATSKTATFDGTWRYARLPEVD